MSLCYILVMQMQFNQIVFVRITAGVFILVLHVDNIAKDDTSAIQKFKNN